MDAGGTKTRAFAVTRGGEIVGRGAGGGANLLSSPDPQGSIAAALREALAGRIPDAVVLSCAGGEREADRAKGRAILAALLGPDVAVDVTHDAKAALYAGTPPAAASCSSAAPAPSRTGGTIRGPRPAAGDGATSSVTRG